MNLSTTRFWLQALTESMKRGRVAANLARLYSLSYPVVSAVLLLACMAGLPLYAQNINADVLGTVVDPTGAVIAGASVTIQNTGTNSTRVTQTDERGEYTFTLLSVGNYVVTVEAKGFQSFKAVGITILAGDRLRVDAKLQVGAGSDQVVKVTDASEVIQTDTSSVSSTIPVQAVLDMPLNGRNLFNLITLQPGINAGQATVQNSGARPDDRRQTSAVSANGQFEAWNNNILDGIDNQERYYNLIVVRPSIEAVQEVQVQTGNFSADVGRAAGAVIQVITKSGTDQFHGSLFEFFRNDILDAREYYTPTYEHNQEWRQNQFGGSLSGPIRKNKTFFFVDAEGFRQVQGINSPLLLVPSLADRAFVQANYMPSNPNSVIGKRVFELYPAPNYPSASAPGANTYISAPNKTQNNTNVDAKLDHFFSQKDHIFLRYDYNATTSFFPGYFPKCVNGSCGGDTTLDGINPGGSGFIAGGSFPGTSNQTTNGAQINYVHMFSPTLLMELRTGFARIQIDTEAINAGVNGGEKLGIPNSNIPSDPHANGMPAFHFLDGYDDLGDQIDTPLFNTGNVFQWNGDVIYTRGAHNFKVGAALVRRQTSFLEEDIPEGWWFFLNFIPGLSAPETMALGFPGVVSLRDNWYVPARPRTWEPSVYAMDDWRVKPWLTLNLGLRYDVFTALTDAAGRISNFDFATGSYIIGGTGGVKTDYSDVSPRFGFAVVLPNAVAIHGGFGLSYYVSNVGPGVTNNNLPFFDNISCSPLGGTCPGTYNGNPVGTLAGGPPISIIPSDTTQISNPAQNHGIAVQGFNLNLRQSYLEQFNLSFQKAFNNNVFTLAYVGSLGRRQPKAWNLNSVAPDANGVLTLVDQKVPYYYPQYPGAGPMNQTVNGATSNYSAMQVSFDRRVAKGLQVAANYTWSHSLNDWSGLESGDTAAWKFNYRYSYGNADLNVKNRIGIMFNYDLPFAQNFTGAKAVFLKGWSVTTSGFWQTGLPFTVTDSYAPGATAGGGSAGPLPNVVPGQSYYPRNRSINGWINPQAFTAPVYATNAAGQYVSLTYGNERVNQLFQPDQRSFNLAARKQIPITERLTVQFRAECFNISNTPNFAEPVNDLNNPQFAQITSTTYGMFPRVFQFALRLDF